MDCIQSCHYIATPKELQKSYTKKVIYALWFLKTPPVNVRCIQHFFYRLFYLTVLLLVASCSTWLLQIDLLFEGSKVMHGCPLWMKEASAVNAFKVKHQSTSFQKTYLNYLEEWWTPHSSLIDSGSEHMYQLLLYTYSSFTAPYTCILVYNCPSTTDSLSTFWCPRPAL